MIQKTVYGQPVETGAVVVDVEGSQSDAWPFAWQYAMDSDDVVFGLGENMHGINKRGFKYVSWCSDVPNQSEFTPSMYGAHNFIIIYNTKSHDCRALFFDTASRITFDIGYSEIDMLTVTSEDTGVIVYAITPDADCPLGHSESVLNNVVRQFRTLIGQSYIPPKWAFGFQQSRWGYKNEQDVRTVVEGYRNADLPLDSVCLDIDYMDSYKDFTIDSQKFPDMEALSSELKQEGIRLVPIIDAGVKIEEGYDVYDEGVQNDYFCKKDDGSPYVAGVWPGRSHFTDFMNPEASEWFGLKYKALTDNGIEGFWNDMNEPAMFYSDESIKAVFENIKVYEGRNLDVNSFFEFTPLSGSTFNRLDDYQRFYHEMKNADGAVSKIRHDMVHNVYGSLMTKAAGLALRKISPDKRMLLYSRASCIGAHRYGGIWTGDNSATWVHLLQEIKMLPSLNMVGFLYTGADIGGFGGSTTRQLLLRWLALGAFTPLMRNHSAWDARQQECYAFGDTVDFKSILDFRYALIPYIYSEFVKAAVQGTMYMRPLGFDYPEDERSVRTEDELLVGEGILIAPVYEENAKGRYVYLPEDMTKVSWCNGTIATEEKSKGSYYVYVPVNTVVFFVKKNHLVPLCKPARHTGCIDTSSFECVGTGSSYDLYEDDGFTRNIQLKENTRTIHA
ncbi:MAG: alpha-glucosidase [Treponema sp.]|nr:alpha-glucosidase [Treponema sp.]